MLDSRTLRSTPESSGRAAWDGSKLHLAVDTLGHLLALYVSSANADDRSAVAALAEAVQDATGESVQLEKVFSPGVWWHSQPAGSEGRAMGQVLHGSATTTEAVRRAIQRSQESVRVLARRHGISPTTVHKRRKRQTAADAAMGPKDTRSTTLTPEQEAMVVAFRRHTLLPLDDCLYALQPTIPALTRSGLHRCLQRHGISRLPQTEGDKPDKKRFKAYPIGYFHVDIAEVSTAQGKLRLFVAIDHTSKFAFARLVESAGKMEVAEFLRDLAKAVPYAIHTVLADNGIPAKPRSGLRAFTNRTRDIYDSQHIFDRVCDEHGIEHRLTKVNHPWTNGQVERMNRGLKEATVRRHHYENHDELRAHLQLFLDAYNHARRLKALRGLTPYEFICRVWTQEPERFRIDPSHPRTEHPPGPEGDDWYGSRATAKPSLSRRDRPSSINLITLFASIELLVAAA